MVRLLRLPGGVWLLDPVVHPLWLLVHWSAVTPAPVVFLCCGDLVLNFNPASAVAWLLLTTGGAVSGLLDSLLWCCGLSVRFPLPRVLRLVIFAYG